MTSTTSAPRWRKASASNDQGACVEIAVLADGVIGVRDSKAQGEGPVLRFTTAEWDAFMDGVRAGEFDHLQ